MLKIKRQLIKLAIDTAVALLAFGLFYFAIYLEAAVLA